MARKFEEKKMVWHTMKAIYKLLALNEVQKIIEILLDKNLVGSTDLMNLAGLTESQFHPVMRQLVKYCIIGRTVNQDRSVSYSLSPFGVNVLDLSKPLLKVIKQTMPEEELVTN